MAEGRKSDQSSSKEEQKEQHVKLNEGEIKTFEKSAEVEQLPSGQPTDKQDPFKDE